MNKNTLKSLLLDSDFDDENTTIDWYADKIINNPTCEEADDIEDEEDDNVENIEDKELSNFNINIIEDNNKEKKVRITLEFNVKLSNMKTELICIDLDINRNTYLKFADELFN